MPDMTPTNNSVPHTTEDRRESPRRKKQIKVQLSDVEGVAEPMEAWVVDRSLGGVCLSVNEEVAPGTVLGIRPKHGPEGLAYIPIEVKSCRQVETSWEIGCQFLRMPSYSVMLLFG